VADEQSQAPPDPLDGISAQLTELTTKSASLIEQMEAGPSKEDYDQLKTELIDVQGKQAQLDREREQAAQALEVKALRAANDELQRKMAERAPRRFEFNVNTQPTREISHPFPTLIARAKRGDAECQRQLVAIAVKTVETYGLDIKALSEGTGTAGGYLVPPSYIQELVALRRATAPLLDYIRQVPVTTNLIYVPLQTTVSTVGWTAENATKTSTDEVLGQLSVNVFTLAGIAKVSNQLLEDSSPAVDAIVRQDLMRGLNIEMDRVVINGSGTGQPTGILNASGVTSTVSTATAVAPQKLLDDIVNAISRLQQTYYGNPSAIVMSPRTWGALMTSKDTTGRFLMTSLTTPQQDYAMPNIPAPTGATADNLGITGGVTFTFAGIPIVVDANMPVNLSGTNSAVIVGALHEAWWLKRDDVRIDMSQEAGTSWESNQAWFRGELRMGFTASRLPSAYQIVSNVVI